MPATYVTRLATPEDAPAIARVHVGSWRTTYPGIVPKDVLDRMSVERRETWWRGALLRDPRTQEMPRHTLVGTTENGDVVGFVSGGDIRGKQEYAPYDGELYSIYLLKEQQRVGLGRRLFLEFTRLLQADGYTSMMLWALEANPACRFYERMGGEVAFRRDIEIAGTRLPEVAYGWPAMSVAAGSLGEAG